MSEANLTEKIDNNNVTPSDSSNNNVENKSADVPKDDMSDVSPSSGVSSASSKSTVSKQSGIRPPSRIGRPCGGIQKPAVPSTPTKNSSDDSIRRLTDDFGRHRLTDLMEMDESEEDGLDYLKSAPRRYRYSSIGSTASSMEGLWDLHPRRLSEAGLSRHSDSSAVLTEDTDSFMIGQRVWVGGTKPGTIAYIGETQFAPGEWAGIALDEPIGKNDGSVAGVRYFQCENKKGVFSRLTRLTREPLEQPGMGSNETFTSPTNGIRRSPISPTGSTRSLLRTPASLSNSNTSLTSSATHVDFKIGDRVIIKSTQGSKVGTVRYMGLTDFAPGEWVGVELDDPRGKNDGSVEGKRYFECRPHFGLFAPISKVSKSPSKHKPGACVVHSGGPGLPPTGIRRANSKESMTSLASRTSTASRVRLGVTSLTPKKVAPKTSTPIPTRTALQDVLREKQQHIEQLLKERDLERAEITRAASQADEAEQKFYTLKHEFEQYRSQCEQKVRESDDILSKLKVDRDELLSQLEDEKRKNEDLQFRFEEASITKSDIEESILVQSATSEGYVKRIKELEAKLEEDRHKAEQLEATSNKLFEAEEGLIKAREEIEALRKDLEQTRTKRETLEEDKTATTQLVESLQKQVDRAKAENEEKLKTISQLTEEVSKIKAENCEKENEQVEKFKHELDHQRKLLEKFGQTHADLAKENEKLKMDLSARAHDLEVATDELAAKDKEIKSLRDELETVRKELGHKTDDLERQRVNLHEVEANLEQARGELKEKITEVENTKKECNLQVSQKDQQISDANKTIAERSEEIKKLAKELEDVKHTFEDSKNEIHSRHARQVASQDSQLMALSAEIQQKNEEITKSSIVISKLEEDLCAKNGIIEKLRLELENFESQKSSHTEASSLLNVKLNELSLTNGDLQRQLASANERINGLLELKQRLETEIQGLTARCENGAQLEQLRAEIQQRESMLERAKAEFEQKLQNSERLRHEIELQRQQDQNNFAQMKADLEAKLRIALQSEESLKQRCDTSVGDLAKMRDEYRMKIDELQHAVQEKDLTVANLQNKCSEAVKQYEDQLRVVNDELNRRLQECQQKISSFNDETANLKQELAKKSEQLIEARAESSHILAQRQQLENELKQKYSQDTKQLEFELNGKNMELEKALTEVQLLRNDCQNTNSNLTAKDDQISELAAQVKNAQNVINQLQEELTTTRLKQQQSFNEHENVQNQCKGLLDQVASLTEQVKNGEAVFKNLEIEHKNAMQLVNRLRITEQQKQQCLQQLQQEASSGGDNKNCDHVMQLLNQVKVDNTTGNTEKILNLQKDLDLLRNQLAERNHQFDVQQNELLRLQQELVKAQQVVPCVGGSQEPNSLIQDKEMAENQIKFLNSIIVDMQKKTEEQRARIEILESGYSPAMADELKLMGSPQRQVPPRVYCDICEEFDLHETEDCPKQNTDLAPANGGQRGEHKHVPERPYCEICEAFGHATEDCQEDQTF
ncbi:CAP-Gly domain-containing linker protein 1 isoform X5 [Tribolium castaneum]|uniref:CAP-Gly domain-containing linker protein 1 isoform X5 n=1 Tax=Tribolium castaneum TaxID=7070 RepID=UPI00046BF534|nr:PREDICTED: CAP-Gly domain-containing linker protein 1 isoform X5 [Tribolium castaneum]|eukprot:XP_008197958.1 PREDICTED: CAP-Gly domain-containing linker protein 1 isoform X5 [Tribolium castaneum]